MIVNVIDLRNNRYKWKSIVAVVESATKNNVVEDGDKVQTELGIEIDFAEREGITVREAFQWAEQLQGKVTLYIYNEGKNDTV